MLTVPKPGARIGLDDPVCHVKSTEELSTGVPRLEHNFEGRKQILLSHVEHLERPVELPESMPVRPGKLRDFQSE